MGSRVWQELKEREEPFLVLLQDHESVLRESGKRREEEREKERARGREKRYRRQEPVSPYFRLQRSASSEKPLFVGTFI